MIARRPDAPDTPSDVLTTNADADQSTELWGDYWAAAGLHGCTEQFPPDVARQLAAGWHRRMAGLDRAATLLDVACGRGAVLAAARDAGALARGATATGVDLAPTAALSGAGFTIRGGVDATALPFDDRSFTLVTSQFGIEYAGLEPALDEAARVAAAQIALLAHAAEGIVAQHAAEQASQAETLLHDRKLAARLRAAVDGGGGVDALLADVAALAAAATNRGLLDQLHGGIAELRRLAPRVPATEMAAAADFMAAQLERHRARMHALARAAPARAQIDDAAARLRARGFDAAVSEQRSPRGDLVGYWLDASRRGQS